MFYVLDSIVTGCSSAALSSILHACKTILKLIQLFGPLLLMVALVIDCTKLVINPDEKKYAKNIKNSVLAAAILFFIPLLVNVTMGLFDDSFSVATCWNSLSTFGGEARYIPINDKEGSSIISDPGEYEGGDERKPDSSGGGSSSSGIEGTAKTYRDVVWDSGNVTRISNLTSQQLIAILNSHGGNAKNFIPYASGLIAAENKYSVNVFFLIGVEALESGWITSKISKNCNNLGGVCQSNAHPSNGCGSNSNCKFAYFNSVNDFIDYHASMLHKNYLTPGGSYFHGTSPSAVVTNYCPGCSSWPGNVTSIADRLFAQASKVM